MVGTIVPVVRGSRTLGSSAMGVVTYIVAQAAGAATCGAIVGWLGAICNNGWANDAHLLSGFLAIVAVCCALKDMKICRFPLPGSPWQVPPTWRRLPPLVMASVYGFLIGTGLVTRITVASFYVLLAICAVICMPATGAAIMALYGLSRAAPIALIGVRHVPVHLQIQRLGRLDGMSPLIKQLDGLALGVAGGVLIAQYVMTTEM